MKIALDADVIKGFVNNFLIDGYQDREPIPQFHIDWWKLYTSSAKNVMIAAPRSHAKAQPLDSLILTRKGWERLRNIKVGDYVIGSQGKPVMVTHLHPTSEMATWSVWTRDGRMTRCNSEHLWTVVVPSNTGERKVVKSLKQIKEIYQSKRIDKKNGKETVEYRCWIPLSKPVIFDSLWTELPLDPYVLGIWLGDGHSAGGRITSADPEIFTYFPDCHKVAKQSGKYLYGISNLTVPLRKMGLIDNKHIPLEYLEATIEQRLQLLQGLMDTDGTRHQDGRTCYFCNTNWRLVQDVVSLVRSLGGIACISKSNQLVNDKPYDAWRVSVKLPDGMNPFRMARKKLKTTRDELRTCIVGIEPNNVEPCRCITVDAKDGIYITDDYLPTHNSTALNHAYGLAIGLFQNHPFQFKVSRTYDLACEKLQQAKTTLVDNEKIKAIFGFKNLEKDTENDFIATFNDGYRMRMFALGMEQKVRGKSWGTIRPSAIVVDDAEDDEQVESLNRREKAMKWFMRVLMPIGGRNTINRVTGTVLHQDSILMRLMKMEDWVCRVDQACDEEISEASILWPQMFPKSRLETIKKSYVDAGDLPGYNMEYRNQSADRSSGLFREEDFRSLPEDLDRSKLTYYCGMDFAISEDKRRDYTAIVVAGMDAEGTLYILDVQRGRWGDGNEIIDQMFLIEEAYHPAEWFAEEGMISKALGAALELRMREANGGQGIFLNITPMKATASKRVRAANIRARVRGKAVRFDREASWFPAFEEECLQFDRGTHDDQVDAMSHLGMGLARMVIPLTEEEEEDFERETARQSISFGRSSTTGY